MNWLFWGVCALFLLFIVVGIVRGFIRIAVSLAATIATVVLVIFLAPYVGDIIKKVTPLESVIEKQCIKMMSPQINPEDLAGIKVEGLDLGEVGLEAAGLPTDEILEALGGIEIPRDQQIKAIKEAKVPEFFRNGLLDNNNKEVYSQLGVNAFPQYIGAYISKIIINIVAFILTFIMVTLVVRIIMYAVGFIGELPIIHGVNRLAGGGIGIITALITVWVLFMGITLIYSTAMGTQCMTWIKESAFLSFLYDNNLLMKWVAGFK